MSGNRKELEKRNKELEAALKKLDKNSDVLKDKQKVSRKESWFWEFYGEDACA